MTGTCTNTLSYNNDPLGSVIVKATYNTNPANMVNSYTVSGVNLLNRKTLSANYYDDYTFLGMTEVPNNANTQSNIEQGYAAPDILKGKDQLTGTLTAQINSDGTISSTYLYAVVYYDKRSQLVQTKSNNHLTGGIEKEYLALNFTGQPTAGKSVHSATGKTTQTELYTYIYDHVGRLIQTKHKLNMQPEIVLAENTYDELGRLSTNKKGGIEELKSTYGYNVRSWTTSITSAHFSQTLYYNESYGKSDPQYNGNISAMSWKVQGESNLRGYAFAYDGLSRLTSANYLLNATVPVGNDYKVEKISYDKHGNITYLERYGKKDAASYGVVDKFSTMTYNGNQLTGIIDSGVKVTISESADFKDNSNGQGQYTYNRNGAMEKDTHKGILGINYNSLNLPTELSVKTSNTSGKVYYVYSASGVKLKTIHLSASNLNVFPVHGSTTQDAGFDIIKKTDYVGNKVYDQDQLKRILVDGGYIEGGIYYFYLTDHLGNNRVVANASGVATQKNHYYPFGMAFAEGTVAEQGKQPYKYNGKELDMMHGLNLYDYSARYYESSIGRFTTVDPMAEMYPSISPYAYCNNNPLKYIDPTGMAYGDYYAMNGTYLGVDPHAEKYYSWSPYAYCYNNPINAIDPDGKDGIFIAFPDYKISTPLGKIGGLGHAGVLLIDNKTGTTKYYEYGRYDKEEKGIVRNVAVPDVKMGKDGKPTPESLNNTLKFISEKAGQGGKIEGAYVESDKFKEMKDYAESKKAENSDPKRKEYTLTGNNCGTFAADVLKQDSDVKDKAPTTIIPRPNGMAKDWQSNFEKITYDPNKDKDKKK